MNALQKTMFVIALLLLIVQTVRHGYHRWVEPRGSVLDLYEGRMQEFEQAKSLNELTKKYDEAYKKVKTYEANKNNPKIELGERDETEPYRSERQLKKAIDSWEEHSREIYKLHFFWFCGLVLLAAGYILYEFLSRWVGLTLLIAGFSEMIYWCSPNFISERGLEFDRMLVQKFAFSLISLLLLIVIAYLIGTISFDGNRKIKKA